MPYNDPKKKRARHVHRCATDPLYLHLYNEAQARNTRAAYKRRKIKTDPIVFKRLNKHWNLIRCFNITIEKYDEMLERQNGVCAICENVNSDGTSLSVDHNHKCCPLRKKSCGKCVRGLLCSFCNTLLGCAEDLPSVLRAAASYLEQYGVNDAVR